MKLFPQHPWTAPLHLFEPPTEIRVVFKANAECNLEDAHVCVHQQVRGSPQTKLVDIGGHGSTSGALEKSTQGRLIRINLSCELGEIRPLIKIQFEVVTDLLNPFLILNATNRAKSDGRKSLGPAFLSQVR